MYLVTGFSMCPHTLLQHSLDLLKLYCCGQVFYFFFFSLSFLIQDDRIFTICVTVAFCLSLDILKTSLKYHLFEIHLFSRKCDNRFQSECVTLALSNVVFTCLPLCNDCPILEHTCTCARILHVTAI